MATPERAETRLVDVVAAEPPPGAPPGGQWVTERYIGKVSFVVGLCCIGYFIGCCPFDERTVYVAPNGARFPTKPSWRLRFLAAYSSIVLTVIVVNVVVHVSAQMQAPTYGYYYRG
eukprot:3334860-Prymnesium_polylepis.1